MWASLSVQFKRFLSLCFWSFSTLLLSWKRKNRDTTIIFKKYLPKIPIITSETGVVKLFNPLRHISRFSFCGESLKKSTFLKDQKDCLLAQGLRGRREGHDNDSMTCSETSTAPQGYRFYLGEKKN